MNQLNIKNENYEFDEIEHKTFLVSIKSRLNDIIKNEPLLDDIDLNTSISELKEILSLEYGKSMKILIKRPDNQAFHVIVKLDGTLKHLKEAIQLKFKLKHDRFPTEFPKIINWNYVWTNYGLMLESEKLLDDEKHLREYGIKNKSEIFFLRKFHQKF